MSVSSLYETCLRKIAINLREGIYKFCHVNPFRFMPSKIVNDIIPAALNHQRADEMRADDLEQLLTSGKIREFKIAGMGRLNFITQLQTISRILHFLTSGCQELETLHLPVFDSLRLWRRSNVSVARTRSEIYLAKLRSEISAALENLFGNTPNLKDLHCSFAFDLKALRKCRKLRRLSLHFQPQQHWNEFLDEDEGNFQTHECLEFFTVCAIGEYTGNSMPKPIPVPYNDVAIILRHCPVLNSLGFVESSGALSQLYRIDTIPFESNLRHCYWKDVEFDYVVNAYQLPDLVSHRVEEAVLFLPMIEELDFNGCCLRSVPCLKRLRNLVYLNIDLVEDVTGTAFNDALQEIGPQLKHLALNGANPMDLSLLLQNCHNLESLRIQGKEWFVNSAVRFPHLQHLTLSGMYENGRRIFSLFSECNQLTELFLQGARYLDDQILHHFLERNSLSSLKVAYLAWCSLTENGFKDFLLSAPQLEKVRIFSWDDSKHYERAITATNHTAQCNNYEEILLSDSDFFQKRLDSYSCRNI